MIGRVKPKKAINRNSITWIPPCASNMKLSTDGNSRANPSEAGRADCGGLFRKEKGESVNDFFCRHPDFSAPEAELFAIYRGLTMVIQSAYSPIYIETR